MFYFLAGAVRTNHRFWTTDTRKHAYIVSQWHSSQGIYLCLSSIQKRIQRKWSIFDITLYLFKLNISTSQPAGASLSPPQRLRWPQPHGGRFPCRPSFETQPTGTLWGTLQNSSGWQICWWQEEYSDDVLYHSNESYHGWDRACQVRTYSCIMSLFSLKGIWPDHFWIHPSKWRFWYQRKAPIFLITPVKFNVQTVQQMLHLKVTSKNVGKVQKWW